MAASVSGQVPSRKPAAQDQYAFSDGSYLVPQLTYPVTGNNLLDENNRIAHVRLNLLKHEFNQVGLIRQSIRPLSKGQIDLAKKGLTSLERLLRNELPDLSEDLGRINREYIPAH